MFVSIAMATYNGEKYLQEQLDSFLSQTLFPDELVISDDGSTDATLAIIEKFSKVAPFSVQIFRNETRLGYAENFGRAMAQCSGDVVFLSDQDDFWFPEKLQSVCDVFKKNPHVWVVINDAEITDEFLESTGLTVFGQTQAAGLSPDDFITGCCSAYRSSISSVLLPIPSATHTHDGWLHILALSFGCRQLLPKSLQLYRRHRNNTSGWVTSSTVPASPFKLQRRLFDAKNFRRNPVEACQTRLLQLNVFLERLLRHSASLLRDLPFPSELKNALSRIEILIAANMERKTLLMQPMPSRALAAFQFYRNGGYSHFEGVKSLVKDVLR